MRFITTLRPDHKELYNSEDDYRKGIYRREWDKMKQEAEFVNTLLADVDGDIDFHPIEKDSSWYSNQITVTYKGLPLDVLKDFKGKLMVRSFSSYRFTGIVSRSAQKTWSEENKAPLNFTFDKLTSKKLISHLEYEYQRHIWLKATAEETEETGKKEYKEGLELLRRISKETGKELKEWQTKDPHPDSKQIYSENAQVLTPFGFCGVTYDYNSKSTNIDYNTRRMIELLDQIKEANK